MRGGLNSGGSVTAAGVATALVADDFNLFMQDEFMGGNGTTGQIGELGWNNIASSVFGAANAGTGYVVPPTGHPGVYRVATTAVNLQSGGIVLAPSAAVGPSFQDAGFKMRTMFRMTTAANISLGVFLANDFSVLSGGSLATKYVGAQCDTGAGDISWYAVCKNGGAVTKTNSTAPINTLWHTVQIEMLPGAVSAIITVDNQTPITLSGANFPSASGTILPIIEVTARAAVVVSADIDFVKFMLTPTRA